MAKASDNRFPKLLLTETAAPTAPAAGDQALFIDPADHKVKRVNSAGTVTAVEGGGGGGAGGFAPVVKHLRYLHGGPGQPRIASTSYVALTDSSAGASLGTALDLTLPSGKVAAGDTIEVGASLFWSAQAIDGFFTFGSLVSGAIVNLFTPSGEKGIPGLLGSSGQYANASGSTFYVVQAGDLSSGALTIRPLAKGSTSGSKELICRTTTNDAMHLWVKNYGPQ